MEALVRNSYRCHHLKKTASYSGARMVDLRHFVCLSMLPVAFSSPSPHPLLQTLSKHRFASFTVLLCCRTISSNVQLFFRVFAFFHLLFHVISNTTLWPSNLLLFRCPRFSFSLAHTHTHTHADFYMGMRSTRSVVFNEPLVITEQRIT